MNHAGDAATRPSVPIRTVLRPRISAGADASAGQAHSPPHRVGEDGAEAERQRVGPAARQRDLDGQRRRAEQSHRHSGLRPGERQHDMRFGPVQAEQAEEAEAPRHARSANLTASVGPRAVSVGTGDLLDGDMLRRRTTGAAPRWLRGS